MEPKPLSNPTILQVVGLPGSGKSFFATQFAETISAPAVSRNQIRWVLFAHHTYSRDEESMVDQVADMLITELLKTKRTIILDGGYNSRVSRNNLKNLAKKHGYNVMTIVVQTDEPTAKQRSMKRSGNKDIDRFKQPLTSETFAALSKTYQAPIVDRNCVVISGKHTYSTQARVVLKKLVETQENGARSAAVRPIVRPRGPFIQ